MQLLHAAPAGRALSFPVICAVVAALCLAALPSAAHAVDTGKAAKTVVIGFAGPLSGGSAAIGKSMEHGVEMALNEATARNLRIDGAPVVFKMLSQDDRGEARTAALVADYLVKAGAVAVVGHWNTAASISAAPIYNSVGIPQIAPGSSGRQYTAAGYHNAYRIIGHDDDTGVRASQYALRTLQAKRIAVIDDDTLFGTMLANQFSKSLELNQVPVVARHTVSSKTSDFNLALADLKNKNPDLVFFGGLMAQAAALQLSLRRAQINGRVMAAGGIVSPMYLELTGADGEGTLGIGSGIPQDRMNGWKKFKEKFVATYGDQIGYFTPFAYDAANMIVAAIKQANSLDPVRLNQALHSMKYQGLSGTISFDAQGNLNNPPYTVFQVQNGKWVAMQTFGGK